MKAQFWSFDVIFAMVIFGTALVLLTFVWFSISTQFSVASGYGIEEMQAQLQSLQRTILLQGNPPGWNSVINITNPSTWQNISIGLGNGKGNSISESKLMTLIALANYNTSTYQASKQMLGIGFDYYIIINGQNINITIGKNPYANKATSIQATSMPVKLQGNNMLMRIEVWTNTTFGVG